MDGNLTKPITKTEKKEKSMQTTIYNRKLETLILEAIDQEDSGPFDTDWEAITYASNRFCQEMHWKLKNRHSACVDWLQGMALNVPYTYCDIDRLGFDSDTYWQNIANAFLRLESDLFHHNLAGFFLEIEVEAAR